MIHRIFFFAENFFISFIRNFVICVHFGRTKSESTNYHKNSRHFSFVDWSILTFFWFRKKIWNDLKNIFSVATSAYCFCYFDVFRIYAHTYTHARAHVDTYQTFQYHHCFVIWLLEHLLCHFTSALGVCIYIWVFCCPFFLTLLLLCNAFVWNHCDLLSNAIKQIRSSYFHFFPFSLSLFNFVALSRSA